MTGDPLGGLDVQAIIDTFPHYVMLVDERHRILMANSATARDLRKLPMDIVGGFCPKVIHGCEESPRECPLEDALEQGLDDLARDVWGHPGGWLHVAVHDTGFRTAEGLRIFLHYARPHDASRLQAEAEVENG